jgi:uncharacterized membrane protein
MAQNNAAPTATRVIVCKPAVRCRHCRSNPIAKPRAVAIAKRVKKTPSGSPCAQVCINPYSSLKSCSPLSGQRPLQLCARLRAGTRANARPTRRKGDPAQLHGCYFSRRLGKNSFDWLQGERSRGEYGRSRGKKLIAFNEAFTVIAGIAARLIEIAAVFFIVLGASKAVYQSLLSLFHGATLKERKRIWARFATWLLLGLELELAADIIRSVVAPTWQDIGKLAAIAAIRTLLNYFLGKDVAELGEGAT